MERARERWAELTNEMLRARGREERVDHRSFERQGIDRDPGRHYGPAAAHMTARGRQHDRLEEAVAHFDRQDTIRAIDREIDVLESSTGGGRGAVGHESDRPRQQRDRTTPGHDDLFPGR